MVRSVTSLIVLLCLTFAISYLMALGSEVAHRSRAGTILAAWSLVLLTGVVVADRLVDL
jgi:hypothetical protein